MSPRGIDGLVNLEFLTLDATSVSDEGYPNLPASTS
jgi:hypothetical protein